MTRPARAGVASFLPPAESGILDSDASVFPSRREGCPLATASAMAVGLPAVATRVGGVPELVADAARGSLVSGGDSSPLVSDLLGLAGDRGLDHRMGDHNRRVARERLASSRAFAAAGKACERLMAERR